eukprot:TRINITY_DN82_c0_g1_i1.p1 TRINITY_DN82_c0_g1~~TRINITY_DN82_c0_g1_i1.p1  ORF type:complete len:300 (-),score=58.46 TRINITY_DN82_c0_g1_i1:140-1039(-)
MDKLLFKFLKTEIETFFLDFKEEDINTNFFKGGMELTNLRLNTDVLQEALSPIVPYIEVVSAVVQKLRVKVPFSQLKAKATEVWISRIDIVLKEPLSFMEFQDALRKKIDLSTQNKDKAKTGKFEYTLFDRVLDGLQLKIDNIHVSFALLGKYKHAKKGPWTPHIAEINLHDLEVYSTDENWQRTPTLTETRAYTHGKPHVWHFKEAQCKLTVRLTPPKEGKDAGIPMENVVLFDRLPIKVRMTQQRLNIDETLGWEFKLLIDDVKVQYSVTTNLYFRAVSDPTTIIHVDSYPTLCIVS